MSGRRERIPGMLVPRRRRWSTARAAVYWWPPRSRCVDRRVRGRGRRCQRSRLGGRRRGVSGAGRRLRSVAIRGWLWLLSLPRGLRDVLDQLLGPTVFMVGIAALLAAAILAGRSSRVRPWPGRG